MTTVVMVCRLDDPAVSPARCLEALGPDERERVARIRAPAARDRAIVARALLRLELAERLGCRPQAVELVTGPEGKPGLAGDGRGWQFNVSHSGERVVLALAPATPVGIDVEARGRRARIDALARHYYAPPEWEAAAGRPEAERRYRFFQLWTLKEAVTKALGRGLWGTIAGVRLDGIDTRHPRLRLEAGAACDAAVGWWHFDLGAGYSMALARIGPGAAAPAVHAAVPGGRRRPLALEPDLAGLRPAPAGTD